MSEPLPVVPLRGLVLFPGMLAPALISRPAALEAVADHMDRDVPLLFVAQVDPEGSVEGIEDLHPVGCLGTVLRTLSGADGSTRILVEGLVRARLESLEGDEQHGFQAQVRALDEAEPDPIRLSALEELLRETLRQLLGEDLRRPKELGRAPDLAHGPARLADYAAGLLELPLELRQRLLEEPDLGLRLELLAVEAAKALELVRLSNHVETRVQHEVDRSQRQYFLREQIRILQEELGESGPGSELDGLRQRLDASGMPEPILSEASRELDRMASMNVEAAEYALARNWLDCLADLPWNISTVDDDDLARAREVLDAEHAGLDPVKERVLEYLAVRQLNPDAGGLILCFVGPPGVGKTSLAKSIAQALGRAWRSVSLGGVRDESEIRGHRRTYIGAMPGRIVQAMRRAGSRNPVLLLDELDKLGADARGDPAAALLEVLDPTQNNAFVDRYLDHPFDLSQVLFVATANVEDHIPPALRDRLEIVRLSGYTEDEKLKIATRHLVPRVRRSCGLGQSQVRVTSAAIRALIRGWTREAGVRELQRDLSRIHRRVARRFVEGRKRMIVVRPDKLRKLLGPPAWRATALEGVDRAGIALGLAWTPTGGDLLFIEAASFDQGRGQLKLTGSAGEVLRESLEAAYTLLRTRARDLGIPAERFREWDHHVHLPEAAIPKDGPSAGLTMLVALASSMSGRAVAPGLAFSGEITLRGRVLPVGGIKEKALAAARAGVHTVLLPAANRDALDELPQSLLQNLHIEWIDEAADALALALPDARPSE